MNSILLHHVGIIVDDIEKAAENLPTGALINDVYDKLQDARLVLYENFGSSYLELIQPLSESSPTWNQLKVNSNHINHFCYSLNKREDAETLINNLKLLRVSRWMPALLFPKCEVMFCYSRANIMMEFLVENA